MPPANEVKRQKRSREDLLLELVELAEDLGPLTLKE